MSSALPLASHQLDPGAPLPASALPALRALEHRFDIDGLRGVAVLSLLAIHCFPSWARGSFIGVDIFFVLSGYLVTEQWLRSPPSRSRVLGFYAGRIRRLVPALCLVLLAYIAFAVLFGLPGDATGVGRPMQMTLAEAMPLDLAGSMNPLIHLWHLAVIALFYLLWPWVLLSTMRRPGSLGWIIGVSLVASLLINLTAGANSSVTGFFSPAARWWELMAGALLAYLTVVRGSAWATRLRATLGRLGRNPQTTRDLLSVGGAVLLAAAVMLTEYTAGFTGWWAVMPVLGTLLLIAAGPLGWVNRIVLSLVALRFYGLISYPLYLWHWPLLCFPLMLGIPLENDVRVIILLASVVLAALTYEIVEKPLRSVAPSLRLSLMLGGLLVAMSLLGWLVTQNDGLRRADLGSMQPAAAHIATR